MQTCYYLYLGITSILLLQAGCDEIWEKICSVQGKDPSVDFTQVLINGKLVGQLGIQHFLLGPG